LIDQLKIKIGEAIKRNQKLAGEVLRLAITNQKASFQFRNVEKWSDEEMREVLSDLEMAKLIEDLDRID
jgi:hypothetical protein